MNTTTSTNTRLRVKVCGMRDKANIEAILSGSIKPDYLGFIFYAKSPRFVHDNALSSDFMRSLASRVATVGVFVNASESDIVRSVERFHFDAVQLHGEETPEFCEQIRSRLQPHIPVQIWKAFSIATKEDVEQIVRFNRTIDLALLDTKGLAHGGNGTRFDWTLLQYYQASMPFFLSGGIAPEHSEEIRFLHEKSTYPHFCGVDINSKFEIAPALKDAELVHRFLSQV